VSFSALNWAVTKAVLDRELADKLPADVSLAAEPGSEAQVVRTEIDRYSIVSGFLTGTWGLLLPFVVKDRIRALADAKSGWSAADERAI